MVRIGDYTLELVEAESKIAFKEHTGPAPNHFVYAEVEPDLEYFIRVTSDNANKKRVSMKVDGVNLGACYVTKGQSKLQGFFECVNGKSTTTALRFVKSKIKTTMASSGDGCPTIWTGKVDIKIRDIGRPVVKEIKDTKERTFKQSLVSGKKGVASAKGSIRKGPKVEHRTNTRISYERGPRVCTITLYYCTTAGLIANRVLVPPPAQPVAETKKAIKREEPAAETKTHIKREKKRKIGEASGSSEDPIEL